MSDAARQLAERVKARREQTNTHGLADSALEGVTVSFLAQVFRMDPAKVKRLLVNCPIKDTRKRGDTQTQHLYDLKTAAEYLVETKADPAEIIKTLKKEDLPPAINTAYWDAQLKRQKWEENAGELWRTEKIREVLGTTFQTIKFTVQLWDATVERQAGLTDEQREILHGLTDGLQAEIFDALLKNAGLVKTGNQLSEIDEMLGMGDALDADAAALI